MENGIKKTKRHRWLVWGVLCLSYIIVFFHRLAVGVVKEDLITTFSITGTAFANLGSAYFYAYMLMQIPSGILADTLGARYTVTIGTILAAVGSIIFGFSPNITVAFIGRLIVGIGVSVVFISILKIQTEWFKESEFGTMSGLTSFVGNIGGLIAQTPLVMLVAALTWRKAFIIIGLISIVVSILCYVFVKNKPSDIGLPPIENHHKEVKTKEKINVGKALLEVCKNFATWPSFILFGGFFGSYVSLTGTWGISFLKDVYGMTKVSAGNHMMLAVLGMSVGSIVIGKLSDIIQKRKLPMIIFGSIYIISWVILLFVNGGKPPVEILGVLFFIMGFSCCSFVLGWACGKEVNNPKYSGISTSVVNIGGFVGAAIVPPIVGTVIDKNLKMLQPVDLYNKAFIYCFIVACISYLALFLVKETNCKNVFKK